MTFSTFLHILTTSRYTRKLEEENAELKLRVEQLQHENLELALRRHVLKMEPVRAEDLPDGIAPQIALREQRGGRPGRFKSFGADKRRLESQEPPQRSVNV